MALYTPEQYRANGIELPAPAPEAPGVGTRILGNLQAGVGDIGGKVVGVLDWLTLNQTPEEQAAFKQVRKEAQDYWYNMDAAKQTIAAPASSFLGQTAESLVRFAPQIPLYAAAGEVAGPVAALGLRAAKLPGIASWLTKAGGGLISGTARASVMGAMEGATVGAVTAEPGHRLAEAGEEAKGFAIAAPVFHVAGKAIGYAGKKLIGKLTAETPQVGELRGMPSKVEAPPDWSFEKDAAGAEVTFDKWKDAKSALNDQLQEGNKDLFVAKDKTYNKYYIAKEVQSNPVATPADIKAGGSLDGISRPEEVKTTSDGTPIRTADPVALEQTPSIGEVDFASFRKNKELLDAFQRPVLGKFASHRERVQAELEAAPGSSPAIAKTTLALNDAYAKTMGLDPEQHLSTIDYKGYDVNLRTPQDTIARGMYTVEEGRHVIRLFKTADVGTIVHDTWHMFEAKLPEEFKTKMADIMANDPQGVSAFEAYRQTGKPEKEFFAYGFEEWLKTGVSPIDKPEIVGMFQQFKQWLTELYQGLKVNGVGVSPRMDKFFSDVFGVTKEQVAVTKAALRDAKIAEIKAARAAKSQEGVLKILNTPAKAKVQAIREPADVLAERPAKMTPEMAAETVQGLNTLAASIKKAEASGADTRLARQDLQDRVAALKAEHGMEPGQLVELANKATAPVVEIPGEAPKVDWFGEGKTRPPIEESRTPVDLSLEGKTMEVRAQEDYAPIPESFEDPIFELVGKDSQTATLRFIRGDQFMEQKIPIADYVRYFNEEGLFQTVFHGGPENLQEKGVKPLTEAERKGTGGAIEGAGFYVTEQHKAGEYYALGAKKARNVGAYLHKISLPIEKMNWLEWDKPVDKGTLTAASEFIKAQTGQPRAAFSPEDYLTGKQFYSKMVEFLGSKEGASQFLSDNGVDGMKYRGQSASGERYKGDYFNYVVYDPGKWLKPGAFDIVGLYQEKLRGAEKDSPEWHDYIRSIEKAIFNKEPLTLETLRKTKDYSDLIAQTFNDKLAFQQQKIKTEMDKLAKPEVEAAKRYEEYADSEAKQETYRRLALVANKVKELSPEEQTHVGALLEQVTKITPVLDRLSQAAMNPNFSKAVNLSELAKLVGANERMPPSELIANLKLATDAFVHMVREDPKSLLANPAKSVALFDKFQTISDTVNKWDERIESAQMSWIYDPKMQSRRWLKGAWAVAADDLFSTNNPTVLKALTKVNGMHWIAKKFPIMQPLYELQWRRLENATILAGDIMQGGAEVVKWKDKEFQLDGFQPLFNLREKDPAAYDWIKKLLWIGDTNGERFDRKTLVDAVQKGFGKPREDIIAAYDAVRNTQDWMFYKTLNYLTQGVEDPLKLQALEKDLAEKMKYHAGYLPHTREGKWVLAVFKDSQSSDTLFMTKMPNYYDATKKLESLKAQYPNNQVRLMAAREAARIGVTAKQELVGLIGDLAKTTGTDEQVADSMRNAAIQMLKEQGFWTHFKERKDVPGFDDRLGAVLHKQATEYAGFLSKMDFAKDGWRELSSLRQGGYNELHNYGRDWFDTMLKSADATDQFFGRLRSLAFLKYLGLNVKSSLVAVAEKATNVPYFLGFYTKEPGKYNAQSLKDVVSWVKWRQEANKFIKENQKTDYRYNWTNALDDVALPKGITKEQAVMLHNLFHKGATRAQFMQEVTAQMEARFETGPSEPGKLEFGKAQSYIDRAGNKVMQYGTWLISNMEQMGRESTALAAFRIFRDKGYDVMKSERMAERLVLDAHFMYGKANQPLWLNKGGVNRIAKLALVFRTQEWNYLSMLGHMLNMPGKEGKLAAAKSLLTLGALGGGMALPFFAGANRILSMTTGIDPAAKVRKILDESTDSEYLGNLFGDGLPAMLGITVAGSMRVGGDLTMKEMLGGAFGSMVTDAMDGARAGLNGDFMTFAEKMLPMVAANPIKAYERYKYGVTTGRGNPVTMAPGEEMLKLSGYQALTHMIGFQPQQLNRAMEKQGVRIRSEEYWKEQRTSIYTLLKKGMVRGDEDIINKAFTRVQDFNMSLPPYVAPITPQGIKQSLLNRPQLRKVLQEQDLFAEE